MSHGVFCWKVLLILLQFLGDKKKTDAAEHRYSCISLRQRRWWRNLCGARNATRECVGFTESRKCVERSIDWPAGLLAGRPAGRPVLSRDALRKYPTRGHAFEIMAAFNGVTGHRHGTARHGTVQHIVLSAVRQAWADWVRDHARARASESIHTFLMRAIQR